MSSVYRTRCFNNLYYIVSCGRNRRCITREKIRMLLSTMPTTTCLTWWPLVVSCVYVWCVYRRDQVHSLRQVAVGCSLDRHPIFPSSHASPPTIRARSSPSSINYSIYQSVSYFICLIKHSDLQTKRLQQKKIK